MSARRGRFGAWLAAGILGLTACSDEPGITDPGDDPVIYDLMFYALAGGSDFAETLVLPPNTGGFPERIFPVGRYARDAAASPDGTRIAYSARGSQGQLQLWVANRDGSNAKLIGTENGDDEWPSWSPDGQRIAFHSDDVGAGDIYVVNADGTNLRRITSDPLPAVTNELHPSWSPDGSLIAFAGNEAGNYDIYTIRPDGSDVHRITRTDGSDVEPAWAPAGDRLAIRRITPAGEWDIRVVGLDGADLLHVALPGWQRQPSWRGDGKAIAFTSRTHPADPWQVFTMTEAGAQVVQQTPDNFTGGHRPVWLPRPRS